MLLSPQSIYLGENMENQYEESAGLCKVGPVTILLIEMRRM